MRKHIQVNMYTYYLCNGWLSQYFKRCAFSLMCLVMLFLIKRGWEIIYIWSLFALHKLQADNTRQDNKDMKKEKKLNKAKKQKQEWPDYSWTRLTIRNMQSHNNKQTAQALAINSIFFKLVKYTFLYVIWSWDNREAVHKVQNVHIIKC